MDIPTQFSYESSTETKGTSSLMTPDLMFEINEINNNRKKKIENIFDEVQQIQSKKKDKEINYVDALNIFDSEYERSLQDMNKISEMLTEEHIVEMISTRKLFFVYKHILEIFAILIGEGYFEWSHFRTKLNIHEIRYRMMNCNLNNFSKNKLNEYLNKIYKNKKLTDEYLKNDNSGIGIIFKWIKAALKICLYKLQIKRHSQNLMSIKEDVGTDNMNNFNNNPNTNNLTKDKITKFSKLSTNNRLLSSTAGTINPHAHINHNYNHGASDFIITNYKESQETEEKLTKVIKSNNIGGNNPNSNAGNGGGFYLTSVNNNNNNNSSSNNNNFKNTLPQIGGSNNNVHFTNHMYNYSDTTIKEEDNENTPNIRKKNIPMIKRVCHQKNLGDDFFQNLEFANAYSGKNRLIEKYNISSLPLLKFKTYHQLKRFFRSDSPKKYKAANSNNNIENSQGSIIPNEIDQFSLRNPKNYEKIVNLLSLGKLKGLDDETFSMFVENMKMDDYFNTPQS